MVDYDASALEAIIARYETAMERTRVDEVYKWEAARCFQQNWDPDASDFADMLTKSLAKAGNLLTGAMYYPAGMLKIFAEYFPDEVRAMMIGLFDESRSLRDRVEGFYNAASDLLERENERRIDKGENPAQNHYQDPRAISAYLAFAHPERNYLYKATMYKAFADAVCAKVPGNRFDKVVAYHDLCDAVLAQVEENHAELIAASDALLSPELLEADPAHHLFVQDITYFVAAYDEGEWIPSLAEFDPGITEADWAELIGNPSVFTPNALTMMSRMLDSGGSATCAELSDKYGESYNFYNSNGSTLGERVADAMGLDTHIEGWTTKWWTVPFVGRTAEKGRKGSFVWKLRPELKAALEAVDLSGCPLMAESKPTESNETRRTWVYAPGEGAWAWGELAESGIMAIGWDELGDLAAYKSREEIAEKLKAAEGTESSKKMDSLTCWQFQNEMTVGDVVYAKKELNAIVGRGIVKSDARYEPDREHYVHVRDVEWTDQGEWDASDVPLPMKTLTDWTDHEGDLQKLETLLSGDAPAAGDGDKSYWWLVANPKIWSFSDIEPGEEQSYTLRNEKGNPRRIQKNLLAAKPGDLIVGYESQPVKKVVAICEVSREHDDERMYLRKVRDVADPVTYETIKAHPVLSKTEFMRNFSGSMFSLTEEEWTILQDLMGEEEASPIEAAAPDAYTDADFLADVFMRANELGELKSLLRRKKNVILQGAPGTGKTFAAKRLAWAMMGLKDSSRIQQVQFHQSSSYDDFVYGYRPNEGDGFDVVPGTFVEFCDRAAKRFGEDFFLIIDEINRANISKVFGELLMLIEADHRGDSLMLPVAGRRFSVPRNVYIIGMMNTADRGLALIDYALRRRFAFWEMEPALDDTRFLEGAAKSGEGMVKLVGAVEKLNEKIAEDPSLGRGFRIGHSYFCPDADGNPVDPASVVKFELAPLIEEYWFDDEKRATEEVAKIKAALE